MVELGSKVSSYIVGVDIGGTFTDCVVADGEGGVVTAKSPTTPDDFAQGMLKAMGDAAAGLGIELGELCRRTVQLTHGTTIGTNAIVQRRGARVGLITTKGQTDIIHIMRGSRGIVSRDIRKVVVRWTCRGTHKGDLSGIAPTGKTFTLTGVSICRVAGGKAVEGWVNWAPWACSSSLASSRSSPRPKASQDSRDFARREGPTWDQPSLKAPRVNHQGHLAQLRRMKIMSRRLWSVCAGLCALAMASVWAASARAQMSEVKEKPPMYSYVDNWNIPRAQWADMEKENAARQKILEKALASGTIVGYGNDLNFVHQPDGSTHDQWWSAMSMAGLLNVMEQFYESGSATSPVLASATKHWDNVYVSRHYDWHSGSWKGAYTHGASYKLKPHAPDDAVDTLSKNLFVPLLEKLLADGTIHEYEIDTEAIHTEAPGTFWIFYLAANAESLDKVNAALREAMKSNPLGGPAFESLVDFTPHRDLLVRTNATYK